MNIAQIAPLYESVPPQAYGGTERVVHYLTEELVALGHDVTLFASGDSRTSAALRPCCRRSLRLDPETRDPFAYHAVMLDKLLAEHERFDVIHFHVDYLHFLLSRVMGWPHLTTLHGRLDMPELQSLYERFNDLPVVSISNAQRAPLPQARWLSTVLHGIPKDMLRFSAQASDYFAFLGRISPEKRADRAVEIATALNVPLRVAAKVDDVDREYHETTIAPLFEPPLVEFIGEIGDAEKSAFLGNARALLFPIDWPEPFGLVMIEAMACGTPVIAFRRGSVPEIIEDGVTGFIVDDVAQAIDAAGRVAELSRWRIREEFERRFTARRMAQDYLALYERVAAGARRFERGGRELSSGAG
ncbi:MAG TPA: glycosyltransferase family 4 protein [Polyangia bacterium]|nr:glycosyltransferase family 4 protein [Polyangia bacterium]